MKQLVRGAIIALLVTVASGIAYYYFQRYAGMLSDPRDAISGDAALILEINDAQSITQSLHSSSLWKTMQSDSSVFRFHTLTSSIDSILNQHEEGKLFSKNHVILLSLHPSGNRTSEWLLSTNLIPGYSESKAVELLQSLIQPNGWSEREFEDVRIYETTYAGAEACFCIYQGILCLSRSSIVIESAIRQLRHGVPLRKQKSFAALAFPFSREGQVNAYVRWSALSEMMKDRSTAFAPALWEVMGTSNEWTGGRVQASSSAIEWKGNCSSTDSAFFVPLLPSSDNTPEKLLTYLPDNTCFFTWLPFDSITHTWKKLRRNRTLFLPQATPPQNGTGKLDDLTGECCFFLTEPTTSDLENTIFLAVRSDQMDRYWSSWESHRSNTSGSTMEKSGIFTLCSTPDTDLVQKCFGRFAAGLRFTCYMRVNDVMFFSNSTSSLRTLTTSITSKKNIVSSRSSELSRYIQSTACVSLTYIDASRIQQPVKSLLEESTAARLLREGSLLRNLGSGVISITRRGTQWPCTVRLSMAEKNIVPATLAWSTALDTAINRSPQVLYTRTGHQSPIILTQDKRNTLYMILPSGSIRVKKPLPESIVGTILPVDFYRSGEAAFVFTTSHQLWVIDQDGNNIGNFPIELPDNTAYGLYGLTDSTGMATRYVIPCVNGNAYAYETDGRPVESFRQSVKLPRFESAPVAVSLKGSLFLAGISSNQKVFILGPDGKSRLIPLEEKAIRLERIMATSDSGFHFIAQTASGKILEIAPDSMNIRTLMSVDSAREVGALGAYRQILTLDSSTIRITEPESGESMVISLPSTACRLAHSRNEWSNHWSVFDPDRNLLYWYDVHGNLSPGFPVAGNSSFDEMTLPGQSGIYLLTYSNEGSVLLYKSED